MSIVIFVALFTSGLLFLYAIGVFAMCLHAGESLITSIMEASSWLAAFSVSHFVTYLSLPLH
ncbi:MAG: hypothetical protein Q8L69_10300 [Gallionellaceae bacterium]|nr:hypothetical protein [Gallionellaceae bacterium]